MGSAGCISRCGAWGVDAGDDWETGVHTVVLGHVLRMCGKPCKRGSRPSGPWSSVRVCTAVSESFTTGTLPCIHEEISVSLCLPCKWKRSFAQNRGKPPFSLHGGAARVAAGELCGEACLFSGGTARRNARCTLLTGSRSGEGSGCHAQPFSWNGFRSMPGGANHPPAR